MVWLLRVERLRGSARGRGSARWYGYTLTEVIMAPVTEVINKTLLSRSSRVELLRGSARWYGYSTWRVRDSYQLFVLVTRTDDIYCLLEFVMIARVTPSELLRQRLGGGERWYGCDHLLQQHREAGGGGKSLSEISNTLWRKCSCHSRWVKLMPGPISTCCCTHQKCTCATSICNITKHHT